MCREPTSLTTTTALFAPRGTESTLRGLLIITLKV